MSFFGVKYYVMQAGPAPMSEGCGEVEKEKEVEEPVRQGDTHQPPAVMQQECCEVEMEEGEERRSQ